MKKRLLFVFVAVAAGWLAVVSCRQSDIRTAVIDVPQMSRDRSIRIVTNAALDEVIGRYDGKRNDYEIDLSNRTVLYHEGQRLLSPDYQRHIEARIREVGFDARVIRVGLTPPAPVPTHDGPVQMWPDRWTAVIEVREMASNTDANIVVDAIAYARLGREDPRIVVRPDSRQVVATYESLRLSEKNIECAIASAGFDANATPANLGAPDSLPHGWRRVKL